MLYIHNPPYNPDPNVQEREIIAPPSPEPQDIHFQAPECHMRGFEMPRESSRAIIALWVWRIAILLLLLFMAVRSAHAQQSDVTIQAVRDGSGNRVAVGDSVNTALRVAIVSGGGSGGTASNFGAAFPSVGTAVGFKDSAGANMQPGNLDASGNIKVNCASGCTGAADTTASGALGALNAAVSIAMAGVNSVGFTLPSNNLVGTLVCEASNDGATTWTATNVRQEGAVNNFWQPNFAVSSTTGSFGCQVPGGASHVRIRVSAYTSGTVTASVRATQQPELVAAISGVAGSAVPQYVQFVGGSDGTNLRAISTDTAGRPNVNVNGAVTVQQATAANLKVDLSGTAANATAIKVDGSAVTQPISAASLPLPTGAATAAKQPALGTAGTPSADVITVQGVTSMTPLKVDGSGVTQPVSGTVTANAGTGTFNIQANASVNVAQFGGSAAVTGTGASGVGIPRVTVSNDSQVQPIAGTTGGATPFHLISAATTNATSVKASAGTVYTIAAFNLNASPRYVKLYDKASAPTVGTDVPVNTFMLPGNASGAGFTLPLPVGIAFANGIAFAITGGMADNDATAIGATEVVLNLEYK